MHRIDDPTAVPTLPAPRPAGTPGYFTGGSPGSSGFAATVVRYEFMNALQEELAAIVETAGITLDKTNNAQVLAALRKVLRFKLFQDTTYYVSPTGSDAADGLTPATAFATGQAAWNKAITIDLNGYNLTIQFANGTYTQPIVCAGIPLGFGATNSITLLGNATTPSLATFSVTNGTCVLASNGANVNVRGVGLQATGPAGQEVGYGLYAGQSSTITYSSVIFGPCNNAHIRSGGLISSGGAPYTISGSAGSHIYANTGDISIANSAISLTGTPAFSNAFALNLMGQIVAGGVAFSGTATGKRYDVSANGVTFTGSGSPNYFPGSVAGTFESGGQYL